MYFVFSLSLFSRCLDSRFTTLFFGQRQFVLPCTQLLSSITQPYSIGLSSDIISQRLFLSQRSFPESPLVSLTLANDIPSGPTLISQRYSLNVPSPVSCTLTRYSIRTLPLQLAVAVPRCLLPTCVIPRSFLRCCHLHSKLTHGVPVGEW